LALFAIGDLRAPHVHPLVRGGHNFTAHPELLAPVLQIIHRVISTFLIEQAALKRTDADTGA